MLNRRRGERVALDEKMEICLIEPNVTNNGPFILDEVSYEFDRKHGVHLNLILTGFRFAGNIDLEAGQEISFLLPERQEPTKANVSWKKQIGENEFMYGVKIDVFINRRRDQRINLDETVEMIVLEPEHSAQGGSSMVEEISYGFKRKHGVQLSPNITGLRFKSNVNFAQGHMITFQIPSISEELKGTVVWREALDETHLLYGVRVE